ncbi:APC family permease [Mycoplasmopsis cricetuli]|uniref:APC family permease n=1 Tax=Mycoplasmopsis cricetuli TaxID=171283 RepID=UPI00046FAF2F|nr:APC family permease [Mycoplasmopsis cricetuli]
MNKEKLEQKGLFQNSKPVKKIGFISIILIVIGSSIGAGIFFKSQTVLENSGNNLILAIMSWIIAAIAVIALALALIEISSGRNDNLGIIGWNQTFTNKYIYKMCKNFMIFIYLPLTYFFMPLYVILSLQDGLAGFGITNHFGTNHDWFIWTAISLVISAWFIFIPGVFTKIGNAHNIVILAVKFIPLIAAGILGFVVLGATRKAQNIDINNTTWFAKASLEQGITFFKISPLIGIFGSLAAIFFAFDGFYVTAGIQTEMKEPKKLPVALVIGIGVITLIYLIIAISMSIGTKGGDFFGFSDWLNENKLSWLFGIINICIAIGVLGIINGFSMWAPRFIEDLIKANEFWVPEKYKNKLNNSRPIVGSVIVGFISIGFVLVLTVIGALGYIPSSYVGDYEVEGSFSMSKLYSFADLMANWISVITFLFISTAILGGLFNRKTKKVKITKSKFFVPSAIISVVIVFLSMFFSFIQPFVDLGISVSAIATESFSQEKINNSIIGNSMLILVLFLFLAIIIIPSVVSIYKDKNQTLITNHKNGIK